MKKIVIPSQEVLQQDRFLICQGKFEYSLNRLFYGSNYSTEGRAEDLIVSIVCVEKDKPLHSDITLKLTGLKVEGYSENGIFCFSGTLNPALELAEKQNIAILYLMDSSAREIQPLNVLVIAFCDSETCIIVLDKGQLKLLN